MSEEGSTERLSVGEAARRLGVSRDAVYKRVRRGTLNSEQGEDGRLYVHIPVYRPSIDESVDSSIEASSAPNEHLERLLTAQERDLEYLRGQLEAEREARRRADHIIAALTERIPELEAPPQTPQEAQEATEGASEGESPAEEASESHTEPESGPHLPRRSWWRRLIGG